MFNLEELLDDQATTTRNAILRRFNSTLEFYRFQLPKSTESNPLTEENNLSSLLPVFAYGKKPLQ